MTRTSTKPDQQQVEQFLHKAGAALQQKQPQEAIEPLQQVLEAQPEHLGALVQLATIYLQARQFDEAERLMKKAVGIDEGNADLWNRLGIVYFHAGRTKDAVEAYRHSLKLAEDANIWNNLGEACREMGDWEAAEAAYRSGLALEEAHPALLANLSALYSLLHRYREAAPLAQEAYALAADLPAVNRAMAWLHINRMDWSGALPYVERCLSVAPNFVEGLLQLAAIRQAEKKYDDARLLLERVEAVRPNMAEALTRTAALASAEGKHEDALEAAQEAVRQKPFLPSTWLALGNTQANLGHTDEARQAFDKALEIAPDYALATAAKASLLSRSGAMEEATQLLNDYLSAHEPHPQLYLIRGIIHVHSSENDAAEADFRKALELNPEFTPAQLKLAAVLQSQKRVEEAEPVLEDLLLREPNNAEALYGMGINYFHQQVFAPACDYFSRCLYYGFPLANARMSFVECLRSVKLTKFSPHHAKAIEICLKDPNLSVQYLASGWYDILLQHPDFELVRDLRQTKDYEAFKARLAESPDAVALKADFFLMGVAVLTVTHYPFERLMVHLRRFALEHRGQLAAWGWEALLTAMARQHFLVEYIGEETEGEQAAIAHMEKEVNADSPVEDILLLACYRLPILSPHASAIAERLRGAGDPGLSEFVRVQLDEPLEELRIKPTIESLGDVADEVSQAVQEQYEENPYPRWQVVNKRQPQPFAKTANQIFPFLNEAEVEVESPVKILIPGCGTGQQSAICASRFADSDILAVDLSRTSLAYAIRRTRELGYENITFRQGDILKLPETLNEKFDYIECTGVLHHLHDPEAGLRILCDLLKPTGYLKLGLYSEIARQSVVAAREFIAEHGFKPTVEGIRACRKALLALPINHPAQPIVVARDFYILSDCRDLIFHVQESRFTLLQLKELFEKMDLEFMGFDGTPPPVIMRQYRERFPDDEHARSLDNWHRFEEENPRSFFGMYQFWVRPKQD